MRFAISCEEPKSLAQVAERMGLTRERVRQIEQDAIRALRRHLNVIDVDH
jgi:RNA polymerase nonessential primary-like sigma factor